MFEDWMSSDAYPTLRRVQRDVVVDLTRAFPGARFRRQDELPLWVKSSALRLEPTMRGRQVAWLRRACDGGWMAVVMVAAGSADGRSQLTMPLWLEPDMLALEGP